MKCRVEIDMFFQATHSFDIVILQDGLSEYYGYIFDFPPFLELQLQSMLSNAVQKSN